MSKSPDAFRTISEVSEWLDTPTYVLRFWESRFPQIKPVKRAGGRRYYRPEDMMLLGGIKKLLHFDELTIKAAKTLLKDKGVKHVMDLSPDLNTPVITPPSVADVVDKADIARMVKEAPAEKPKPSVEVRVLKRVKQPKDDTKPIEEITEEIAPAPEEMPVKSTQKDDLGKADADQDVKADAKSAAKSAPESAAKTGAEDKPAEPPASSPIEQAKAAESQRQAAAQKAADAKNAADEEAEDWSGLVPDMVMNVPYRIGIASDYDTQTLSEIETLYYSLHMTRNRMRRAIKQSAKQAG